MTILAKNGSVVFTGVDGRSGYGPIMQQDNDGLDPHLVLEHFGILVDGSNLGRELQSFHR